MLMLFKKYFFSTKENIICISLQELNYPAIFVNKDILPVLIAWRIPNVFTNFTIKSVHLSNTTNISRA